MKGLIMGKVNDIFKAIFHAVGVIAIIQAIYLFHQLVAYVAINAETLEKIYAIFSNSRLMR